MVKNVTCSECGAKQDKGLLNIDSIWRCSYCMKINRVLIDDIEEEVIEEIVERKNNLERSLLEDEDLTIYDVVNDKEIEDIEE